MQNGDLSNLRRATAGFAAGITEALVVVTPFEVVKIKLQQQKGTSKELLKYRVSPGCQRASPTECCCIDLVALGLLYKANLRSPAFTYTACSHHTSAIGAGPSCEYAMLVCCASILC